MARMTAGPDAFSRAGSSGMACESDGLERRSVGLYDFAWEPVMDDDPEHIREHVRKRVKHNPVPGTGE
jgi:hypothetical protein